APTPTAAFFTVAPKAAGFAIFIRFFYTVFGNNSGLTSTGDGQWVTLPHVDWAFLLSLLSALTMTLGNLCALWQKNAKRMLAYSSIAHAGYMLMGFIVLSKEGLVSILFYLVVYFLMNFGAFFVVGLLANKTKSEEISHFKGLGWTSPLIAFSMAVFLFSLTGIPPFAGFIGKVYLFSVLVQKEIYWLLVVAILNTVISLYYYMYIVREMFLERPPSDKALTLSPLHSLTLILLVIPTFVFGLYWEPLFKYISSSLQFIVTP
ncbi:MAG: NADH-quinone oxidoreductase subunit N, partial [Deltaproteobacteria bacterium]|nr:NADH-quinone oxidoreductase subunit N [Deltaproteobacteria bacterium]